MTATLSSFAQQITHSIACVTFGVCCTGKSKRPAEAGVCAAGVVTSQAAHRCCSGMTEQQSCATVPRSGGCDCTGGTPTAVPHPLLWPAANHTDDIISTCQHAELFGGAVNARVTPVKGSCL